MHDIHIILFLAAITHLHASFHLHLRYPRLTFDFDFDSRSVL